MCPRCHLMWHGRWFFRPSILRLMCRRKKRGFICSALSEHWISLFRSLLIGGGRNSCWCALDHPRRDFLLPSRRLVIGLFRLLPWPIRCAVCLQLWPWGPTLLEAWRPLGPSFQESRCRRSAMQLGGPPRLLSSGFIAWTFPPRRVHECSHPKLCLVQLHTRTGMFWGGIVGIRSPKCRYRHSASSLEGERLGLRL